MDDKITDLILKKLDSIDGKIEKLNIEVATLKVKVALIGSAAGAVVGGIITVAIKFFT